MTARTKTVAAAMICFIAAALLYAPTLSFNFLQWDDQYHLTTNPFIQPDSPDRFAHFWREPYGNLYVPITYNVWALVYGACLRADGTLATWPLHALNVVVHAANVAIAFFIVRRLSRDGAILPAVLGAMLFAIHPLQVESVAWISELRGLLAAMFALLATWVHISGSRSQFPGTVTRAWPGASRLFPVLPSPEPGESARRTFVRSILVTSLLALGLLCKPSVAMMPLVWLALELLIRTRRWKHVGLSLVLPMLLVVASLLSMRAMQSGETVDAGTAWQRPFIAGDAATFYLRKLAWPFALSADYSRTPAFALADGAFRTWIVAAAMLLWGLLRLLRTGDWVPLTALVVFFAALSPVLGLVPFDFQRLSTVADRYVYVAMLGPALLLMRFASSSRSAQIACGVLLALLAWRNVDQQRVWKNDETLWTHAATVNPRAVVATANLADRADQRGDDAEAARLYERVIQMAPNQGNGYRGLAKLAAEAGDVERALQLYQQACDRDPTDAFAWDGSASMLMALNRPADAETAYRKALKLDPKYSDAWNNLGALLLQTSRADEAAAALERAVVIHPRHPRAWANLSIVRDMNSDGAGAVAALSKAEQLHGIDPGVRRLLVAGAMRRSDWPAAERWLGLILRKSPDDVAALNDLGQVLAAAGRVDESIATFERAVALRPDLDVLRDNLESARKLKSMRP